MMDFERKRLTMVEQQLKSRGISNKRVLAAFERVPRHLFVPSEEKDIAYEDFPLPIGEDQTISQPYMVAIMTELLELKNTDNVLEVGTGSGFQTAILAELAEQVTTIERFESLAKSADEKLKSLGYKNIEVVIRDGTEGYIRKAPYDAIVVTAGCPNIPQPLIDQLKDGGRLVIPVGDKFLQTLYQIKKIDGEIIQKPSSDCRFVPLIGKYGWLE